MIPITLATQALPATLPGFGFFPGVIGLVAVLSMLAILGMGIAQDRRELSASRRRRPLGPARVVTVPSGRQIAEITPKAA